MEEGLAEAGIAAEAAEAGAGRKDGTAGAPDQGWQWGGEWGVRWRSGHGGGLDVLGGVQEASRMLARPQGGGRG